MVVPTRSEPTTPDPPPDSIPVPGVRKDHTAKTLLSQDPQKAGRRALQGIDFAVTPSGMALSGRVETSNANATEAMSWSHTRSANIQRNAR